MPPQQSEVDQQQGWGDNEHSLHTKQHSHGDVATSSASSAAAMEQLDPFEPVERRSIFHRESFLTQFASKKGPRALVLLIVFLAMGLGSTIGVVPAVMTDRFARLNHGYTDDLDCAKYEMGMKPQACLDGSADAQNVSALGSLVSNVLTFATSSLMGSLSDEHGRRGKKNRC